MKFFYEAHNKWGEPMQGQVDAMSEEEAAGKIRAAGLFAREIGTEPIGKAKYDQGAVSAGPTQTRVYSPQKDDIADLAAGTTHVDEKGEPVLPTAEEVNSLRMTSLDEYADQVRPDPGEILEPAQAAIDRRAARVETRDVPEGPTASYVDQDGPIKPRPLKKTYDDEKARQKEIENKRQVAAAWQSNLAKELEGISTVLSLMGQWRAACKATTEGAQLPPGVPSVGGRTWDIYEASRGEIAADLIKAALGRAAQRMPIERIVKGD